MCKVVMILDNPFCPDPRVAREAEILSRSGYHVMIYAWDRDSRVERPSKEIYGGYEVIRIPVKSKQQLGIQQFLKFFVFSWHTFWMIIHEEFDVIHCHDFLNLPLGVLIKFLKKIPLVYDAHEIYWIMESMKYPDFLLAVLKRSEKFLLQYVDFFITVGQIRVEYYKKFYQRPIYIVGNWYDPPNINKKLGEELRCNLGIAQDAFLITYGGTLSKTRSSDLLLKAIDKLQNEGNINWIICGSGVYQTEFEQSASRNHQLHFLGWVDDMAPILSASDALIYLLDLTHPYANFASPNNLYISIAWSLPLIAAGAGEIGNILIDEESGILLSTVNVETISSAINKLALNMDLSKKIISNLEILQDQYSWKSASQNLLSIYQLI